MAKEIEHTVPGIVGELGLDLGLDSTGTHLAHRSKFEAVFANDAEAGSARTLSLSVQRPLRFAKFLAGYDEGPEAGSPAVTVPGVDRRERRGANPPCPKPCSAF